MNKQKLGYMICETELNVEPNGKIVGEKNKKPIIETVLQRADSKNRNGRYYEKTQLFPELTCPRSMELLSTGNMKGEAGHPMQKDLTRQQTIDPTNVQVKYLKWWTEGDLVIAHCTGTNNALGESFNKDILDGEKPSFSLRALGTITNTNRGAEVQNLKLITYDRVYFPSHPEAYSSKLVSESSIVLPNGRVLEKNKGLFAPITNEKIIDYIKEESANLKVMKESFDVFYDYMELLEGGKVELTDNKGNIFVTTLENYIEDEIMNYWHR